MNDLRIIYPNVEQNTAFFNTTEHDNHFKGDLKKRQTLEPNCRYTSKTNQGTNISLLTDNSGKIVEYGEYVDSTKASVQKLKEIDGVQIKTTDVIPVKDRTKAYKSIQRLDKETGHYSITRLKGDKPIGGYEVILKSTNRKFGNGFKGKIEKFAINIATDANGCERKGLKQIGNVLFKIARKFK